MYERNTMIRLLWNIEHKLEEMEVVLKWMWRLKTKKLIPR